MESLENTSKQKKKKTLIITYLSTTSKKIDSGLLCIFLPSYFLCTHTHTGTQDFTVGILWENWFEYPRWVLLGRVCAIDSRVCVCVCVCAWVFLHKGVSAWICCSTCRRERAKRTLEMRWPITQGLQFFVRARKQNWYPPIKSHWHSPIFSVLVIQYWIYGATLFLVQSVSKHNA
jgi:hypothetical protein